MGMLNRRMMKSALLHMLKDGKEGIEAHRTDAKLLLKDLTEEQLSLHLYALEQSLLLARSEWANR